MIDINKIKDGNWKNEDKIYLKELQSFLDKVENIQNQELKKEIIFQMLKCDKKLTILAEDLFKKYYDKGFNEAIRKK